MIEISVLISGSMIVTEDLVLLLVDNSESLVPYLLSSQ